MIYEFILSYHEKPLELLPNSIKVGIDKGALEAINLGIKLDYAIGDFDSISEEEYLIVKNKANKLIKLDSIKDDTDTEHAINYFSNYEKIIIHGGLKGKRIEHFIANYNLVLKYPNIYFIDDNTKFERLNSTTIFKDEYKYISIFAKEGSTISLSGFKYNLDSYTFTKNDNLCISNELVEGKGIINFEGIGVIFFTKKDI